MISFNASLWDGSDTGRANHRVLGQFSRRAPDVSCTHTPHLYTSKYQRGIPFCTTHDTVLFTIGPSSAPATRTSKSGMVPCMRLRIRVAIVCNYFGARDRPKGTYLDLQRSQAALERTSTKQCIRLRRSTFGVERVTACKQRGRSGSGCSSLTVYRQLEQRQSFVDRFYGNDGAFCLHQIGH